jgi:3-deoxy-D-manno-octulosonic-acid transferase
MILSRVFMWFPVIAASAMTYAGRQIIPNFALMLALPPLCGKIQLSTAIMNRFLYSLVLLVLSPLLVLYLAFRAIKSEDYRGRWAERFGLASLQQTDLLIHSVSMGETLAAIPLIRQIQQRHPQLRLTVTTTSPTGSAEVRKALGDTVQHCYLPFDIAWCVRRFLGQLRPRWCIIMETELWPNLLHYAKGRGVRLMLANGRLSQKSATQYHKLSSLTLPMLAQLDLLAVQTRAEVERFAALGVDGQKMTVCGSLKFDLGIAPERLTEARAMRRRWGREGSPVWVAGSVHPGEFDAVLQAHKQLLSRWPDALLILVPRHPEQFDAAATKVAAHKLNCARRSQMQDVDAVLDAKMQVLLGDTMGELLSLYGAADQAFVGGTLIENGGHNPLEPAAMGLAVFMGPHHWDFAEITRLLKEAGALKLVASGSDLASALIAHVERPETLVSASEAGRLVVERNRGALQRQLALVERLLAGE